MTRLQDPNDDALRGQVVWECYRRFTAIDVDVERLPGAWERGGSAWALWIRYLGRWHLIGRGRNLAELVELAKTFELPQ